MARLTRHVQAYVDAGKLPGAISMVQRRGHVVHFQTYGWRDLEADGFAQLSEEAFLRDFAGDLAPAKARILYAVQGRIADTLFTGKTTQAAWRSKPSWYAISTEDRTISPALERFMAARMQATTIEVKASHLSLISHPHEITHLIVNAAGQSG